jgi:hypothetical protein
MRSFVLAVSLLVPAQAFALSCVEPTVAASYANAATSEDSFLIGTGTFSFDESLLPASKGLGDQPAKETRIPATISGNAFLGVDFDQGFEANVELVVGCILSWCGSIAPDVEHLVFLKEGAKGYELSLAACGEYAFANPTPEMLGQVKTCFSEGNCTADAN